MSTAWRARIAIIATLPPQTRGAKPTSLDKEPLQTEGNDLSSK
jgi:hypothetical protein